MTCINVDCADVQDAIQDCCTEIPSTISNNITQMTVHGTVVSGTQRNPNGWTICIYVPDEDACES